MRFCLLLLLPVLFNIPAAADDRADRDKLAGTWQAASGETWTIEPQADSLHVVYSRENQKLADFNCNTLGRDCDVKIEGHSAKVSFYYNGSALVELETRGNDVVKRRFAVKQAGDEMQLDVTPITGSGKAEAIDLKRAKVETSSR
jgi:hypothetical protein